MQRTTPRKPCRPLDRACFGGWIALALLTATPELARAEPDPPPPPPATATPPTSTKGAADGPAAPTDAKGEADRLDAEGREHYRAGRYREAYGAFEAAYAQEPRPNLIYNMARCQEKLAAYAQALELLQRYLAVYREQTGGEPANKADVENLMRTLKQRSYESLPEVTIASSPPGAAVRLLPEGVVIGNTPLTTHLKPGIYKLRLELDKHAPLETDVVVPESGKVRAVLALKPTYRLAAISFWCNVRQVKVAVDGKVVAVTPFSGHIDVTPGRHQVSLSREGYGAVEEIVDVPEDKQLHLDYNLQPLSGSSSWRSALGWTLVVLGGSGIGVGVATGRQADQYYRGSPDFDRWAQWQQIGYGAGGAGFGLGLGLVLWDAIRDNIPEQDLAPGPTRGQGQRLTPLGETSTGEPR